MMRIVTSVYAVTSAGSENGDGRMASVCVNSELIFDKYQQDTDYKQR